ncbi:LA_1694 family PerA/PerB upregulated protein [Leptospira weilii]|uniref:LA_1694 family PerA/PerB upregulated protein n=1 Tax=Leptospira weilii TaxID=28184 RepID=UPI0005626E8A
MLVALKKRILPLIGFVCILLFSCIQENASNPSLQLALIEAQLRTVPEWEIPEIRACLVNAQIASGTITTCYEVEKKSCNLDFFNNIKTPTILQNRRDDLTFISINFPNCTAGSAPLFVKYSNLQTPASLLWKDSFGWNGANIESQFQFTNQRSCKDLGLYASPYIASGFSRLLNSQELSQLNNIEAELALIPTTSAACMNDLNFSNGLIDLAQNIKNGTFLRGITCAYQTGLGYPICPWSR